MNSILNRVITLSTLLGLAGCFDIEQTLVVHADQSADFTVVFSIDSALIELGNSVDVDLEETCNTKGSFGETELPGELKRTNNVRIVDSILLCEYTISGPLNDFQTLSSSVDNELGDVDLLSLERLDDSRARIVAEYDFSDATTERTGGESIERSVRRMIASNFEGHAIRWSINAPTILDSNGVISADGRRVTWEVPLQEAIVHAGSYRFEAVIDVQQYRPRFF